MVQWFCPEPQEGSGVTETESFLSVCLNLDGLTSELLVSETVV